MSRLHAKAAAQAVQLLVQSGGRHIALILHPGPTFVLEQLTGGYRRALLDSGYEYDKSLVVSLDSFFDQSANMLLGLGVNGVVCQDMACARRCTPFCPNSTCASPTTSR